MPEVIYVLTNEGNAGTNQNRVNNGRCLWKRIKQLDNTSIPLPFECFYAAEVTDAAKTRRRYILPSVTIGFGQAASF